MAARVIHSDLQAPNVTAPLQAFAEDAFQALRQSQDEAKALIVENKALKGQVEELQTENALLRVAVDTYITERD